MANHDFQVGDKVWTVADPLFKHGVIKILEGVVESKWTSPRGDEFAYDIKHSNGIVYRNIPGIVVHDSMEDMRDAITHTLSIAVETADMSVSYYTRHLEDAKHDKERLQRMLQEWLQEGREAAIDKQSEEQHDRPPLMLSEDAIKEMDTWKGFGPHGPCPRCGSKYYNRANSKTDWWLCCDCGFSYKESPK